MLFKFASNKLEELYYSGKGAKDYPFEVVRAFVKKVNAIKDASNENDLRKIRSLNFESMKGEKGKYSIRLNKSWRLIVSMTKNTLGKIVIILEIVNHYGD